MTEKQFENKVKKFLSEQNCWYVKYWGGGKFTKAGVPDLLICCNGTFVAVELKCDRGVASDLQIFQLSEIRKSGGIALLLYPSDFEGFKLLIKELKNL